MKLTRLALDRPVTTIMVFVSTVMIGLISTRMIPLEFFPEMDAPFLQVQLPYVGSSPEEIERQITRPAEEALATIPGIRRMTSWADANSGSVNLMFDWGEDTKAKAIEVREKLDNVRDQFPSDFDRYFVRQESTSEIPILELRISSQRNLSNAYELLDRKLKRPIERIEGVSSASLNGVAPRELRVELVADRVAAHRVDLADLAERLQQANFAVTAGKITDANRRLVVRPVGQLTTVEQVEGLVIAPTGLRLGDVAEIVYGEPVREFGRHLDREYAIALQITKEAGANTVEVTRAILRELGDLRNDPEMQGIQVYEMDNLADGIVSSINELLKAGLIGAVLAFCVLFFFLRRMSTTLVVAISVPISLLITVGVLYFMGLSLNVLTMMGLMIAVGMLVDNAVVVTESIHRYQTMDPANPAEASRKGVHEVALAVTAGTATTAIVFLPMILSPADEVTLYLKHVSITICVALAASLLLSLTIVPMLMSRIHLRASRVRRTAVDRMIDRYARILDWTLRHPVASRFMAVGVLMSVAVPGPLVSNDFFDETHGRRQTMLHYHLDGTYSLERVEEAVNVIEEYLYANKERFDIESVYSWFTPNEASSTLILNDGKAKRVETEEVQRLVEEGLPKLAIARPNFSWRRHEGTEESVRVTIRGESSERLAEIAEQVAGMLDRVPGFKNAMSEAERGRSEVHVRVDRERARQYGLSTETVAQTVSAAMRGRNLRRFHTADGEVQMRLQFQDIDKQDVDDLANLRVERPDGPPMRLAALAEIRMTTGPRGIYRENRATMTGVHAQLDGMEPGEARAKLSELLNSYDFPTGYSWAFGQAFDDEQQSRNIMLRNLLLALLLIYLVMAGLFESLIHPAAIWVSIGFAIVGVYWFFLFTGTTMSLMAMIGILVLIGVVVNNGIVLVDHINHLRGTGMERHVAIVTAGRDRFRPIIMTAGTTILGLIPLCVAKTLIGGDGPPYFPMARAIVGGLAFSTLVTLVILPTIYVALDNLRYWGRNVAQFAATGRRDDRAS